MRVQSRALGLLAATAICVAPAAAQNGSIGGGVDYLGYSFDAGLGTDAVQLMMLPVAARFPLSNSVSLDIFGAWAEGRVEQGGQTLELSGPVDSNVKIAYQAAPWALVAVAANLPTGQATHTNEEAVVASVLSSDLLNFRETTWGTGLAITSSVAAAARAGSFGLGIAAAYAARSAFEPRQDQLLEYTPGNEIRVRVGLDRNFGNSTLTFGGTFVNYALDKITDDLGPNRNLFQAGSRLRFDASYAFRSGDGVWTIYAANLMRNNGDRFVDLVDGGGNLVGDSTVVTSKQDMMVAGLMGSVSLGGGFVFRPHVDVRVQGREEADGSTAGSGWIVAAGGDVPLRLFGTEFFPKARVHMGSIESITGDSVSTLGFEFKGTFRLGF